MSTETLKPMQSVIMDVSPQQATRWLEGNVRNRKLDQSHVDRLATDMKAGKWKITHQGIAFTKDGVLADGQHRLWAVIMSNCTVAMLVSFNVPEDCIEYVDGGKVRTAADRMSLCGRFGDGVSGVQLATLRAMVRGFTTLRQLSFSEEIRLMARHKPAVDFACKHLYNNRTKGISSAIARGVVARAWYSVEHTKLKRFCEVLKSGITCEPREAVIVLLRDCLVSTDRSRNTSLLRQLYGKVERALCAYLKSEKIGRLYPVSEEYFALPEENTSNKKERASA